MPEIRFASSRWQYVLIKAQQDVKPSEPFQRLGLCAKQMCAVPFNIPSEIQFLPNSSATPIVHLCLPMNNTRLETQEVKNAVVSIHFFFPIPGCFLTSPFLSVQSPRSPTRFSPPARFVVFPRCTSIFAWIARHSSYPFLPCLDFLAGFNVEHRRPSRLAMHHHAKQVIPTAAGSGIGSSGDRMQSTISSKVTFTKFAMFWNYRQGYKGQPSRPVPFQAAGHAYTHAAIFIELLKAPLAVDNQGDRALISDVIYGTDVWPSFRRLWQWATAVIAEIRPGVSWTTCLLNGANTDGKGHLVTGTVTESAINPTVIDSTKSLRIGVCAHVGKTAWRSDSQGVPDHSEVHAGNLDGP
ncbi:hypothetical protein DFH08DRAFT_812087 [Mycena albidolilacea]|uniref:Uncharacterized protein n=1 Tax=Mycena albidolilacea TaxID=1033008 RepID=A0AAD7EMW7_9AGAR|nr:hypothetical protein DFH08DRAFT_812087 [Mycena albidolilacea]